MGVGGRPPPPAALPPGKRPGTHCIGGWVGPRTGLDGCEKSRPLRDSIPVASSYTDYVIPAHPSKRGEKLKQGTPLEKLTHGKVVVLIHIFRKHQASVVVNSQ